MEVLSMFDAWAHAEASLDNMQRAQYTEQELNRLLLGYLRREHDTANGTGTGYSDSLIEQEYDVNQSRAEWLREIEQN